MFLNGLLELRSNYNNLQGRNDTSFFFELYIIENATTRLVFKHALTTILKVFNEAVVTYIQFEIAYYGMRGNVAIIYLNDINYCNDTNVSINLILVRDDVFSCFFSKKIKGFVFHVLNFFFILFATFFESIPSGEQGI